MMYFIIVKLIFILLFLIVLILPFIGKVRVFMDHKMSDTWIGDIFTLLKEDKDSREEDREFFKSKKDKRLDPISASLWYFVYLIPATIIICFLSLLFPLLILLIVFTIVFQTYLNNKTKK